MKNVMNMDTADCCDHASQFAPKVHPDAKKNTGTTKMDHQRAAAHPQHHTAGKMRSQMNPDHGPHK